MPGVRVEREQLEAEAKKAAERWPGFAVRPAKKGERGWQLTLEVEALGERAVAVETATTGAAPPAAVAPGTVERVAAVHLRLVALGAGPADAKPGASALRYETSALVRRRAPAAEPFEQIAREAVRDAADDVDAAIELAGAKDEKVLEALSAPVRGVRVRAIAMCGERRLKAAVPALVALVRNDDEDQDLVLKAIGALVAIKDDRAVGALIDAGRRRSAAYLTQILFAVATLGGKEAEAYLFTVSTGHPEPEVRRTAKEALAELERRKSAPLEPGSPRE